MISLPAPTQISLEGSSTDFRAAFFQGSVDKMWPEQKCFRGEGVEEPANSDGVFLWLHFDQKPKCDSARRRAAPEIQHELSGLKPTDITGLKLA